MEEIANFKVKERKPFSVYTLYPILKKFVPKYVSNLYNTIGYEIFSNNGQIKILATKDENGSYNGLATIEHVYPYNENCKYQLVIKMYFKNSKLDGEYKIRVEDLCDDKLRSIDEGFLYFKNGVPDGNYWCLQRGLDSENNTSFLYGLFDNGVSQERKYYELNSIKIDIPVEKVLEVLIPSLDIYEGTDCDNEIENINLDLDKDNKYTFHGVIIYDEYKQPKIEYFQCFNTNSQQIIQREYRYLTENCGFSPDYMEFNVKDFGVINVTATWYINDEDSQITISSCKKEKVFTCNMDTVECTYNIEI